MNGKTFLEVNMPFADKIALLIVALPVLFKIIFLVIYGDISTGLKIFDGLAIVTFFGYIWFAMLTRDPRENKISRFVFFGLLIFIVDLLIYFLMRDWGGRY